MAWTKERGVDMPWARKVLVVLLVGFVLFYLVSRPESAADAVRTDRMNIFVLLFVPCCLAGI